jgi:PQQ-like domain
MKSPISVVAHSTWARPARAASSPGSSRSEWPGAPAVALMPATALATNVRPAIASGDWTQFHNGPTHQGYNAQENAISASNAAALGRAWAATTGGVIQSSPAVADDVVYVGSSDGKLYAFDLVSGATYHALAPIRILDTRNGTEAVGSLRFPCRPYVRGNRGNDRSSLQRHSRDRQPDRGPQANVRCLPSSALVVCDLMAVAHLLTAAERC